VAPIIELKKEFSFSCELENGFNKNIQEINLLISIIIKN